MAMVKKYAKALLFTCIGGALFLGLSVEGRNCHYPVLGTDMIMDVQVIEDHKDALSHWQDIGVKDAVLINIDAHDDLRRLPAEGSEKYPAVSNGNFIQSAAKQGIVKKVIWVVPDTYDLFSDSGQRLAALLKKYGFAESDISTFKKKDSCFCGFTDGVPLTVCDIGTLPDLKGPILLTIDVDYFPEMIRSKRPEIAAGLQDTFNAMCQKKYKIKDVTVAYSINGGFMDCHYRWVGEMVVDSLRVPGLLSQKKLPYRYGYLQAIDNLLLFRRYEELLQEFAIFQGKGGSDPDLFLYAATACLTLGQTEKAFRYAENACLIDRGYCYGLAELGTSLLNLNKIATAERFFLRGYELAPKMDLGQFQLGMALKEAGRFDEAIRYFKIFRKSYGPLPIDFYIADTYRLEGDSSSALVFYNSGKNEITKNPSSLDRFADHAVTANFQALYEQQLSSSGKH